MASWRAAALGLLFLLLGAYAQLDKVDAGEKVKVSVYYESYCPDSRNFIVSVLSPAYAKAPGLIDLDLVPYGKATTQALPEGGYSFTCQHGVNECEGNKIHACVVEKVPEKEKQLTIVNCMMTLYNMMTYEEFGKTCADAHGADWEEIWACAQGTEGGELLNVDGERTHALSPGVTFIPTVLLNESQDNQDAILRDVLGEICNLYSSPKPEECN